MKEQSIKRLESLIHGMPMGVLVEDGDRKIIYVNSVLGIIFGVEPDSLLGQDCGGVLESSLPFFVNPEEIKNDVSVLLKARTVKRGDKVKMKDGRVLVRDYIPVDFDGVSIGNMWLYQDVTKEMNDLESLTLLNEKMTGRELKMIELKEENAALKKRLGL